MFFDQLLELKEKQKNKQKINNWTIFEPSGLKNTRIIVTKETQPNFAICASGKHCQYSTK